MTIKLITPLPLRVNYPAVVRFILQWYTWEYAINKYLYYNDSYNRSKRTFETNHHTKPPNTHVFMVFLTNFIHSFSIILSFQIRYRRKTVRKISKDSDTKKCYKHVFIFLLVQFPIYGKFDQSEALSFGFEDITERIPASEDTELNATLSSSSEQPGLTIFFTYHKNKEAQIQLKGRIRFSNSSKTSTCRSLVFCESKTKVGV